MAKIPPYALFLHLCTNQRKESQDPDFEGCEDILAYLAVQEANGKAVKITNLVQSLCFGTGPTVHRKVATMAERGLIDLVTSPTDARAKNMTITSAGTALLKEKSKLMKQCLDS